MIFGTRVQRDVCSILVHPRSSATLWPDVSLPTCATSWCSHATFPTLRAHVDDLPRVEVARVVILLADDAPLRRHMRDHIDVDVDRPSVHDHRDPSGQVGSFKMPRAGKPVVSLVRQPDLDRVDAGEEELRGQLHGDSLQEVCDVLDRCLCVHEHAVSPWGYNFFILFALCPIQST